MKTRVCLEYFENDCRTVVGLTLASSFQECVAMYLKFYYNTILLHLVYHTIGLSVTSVAPSKEADMIIKAYLAVRSRYMDQQRSSLLGTGENLPTLNLEICNSMKIRGVNAKNMVCECQKLTGRFCHSCKQSGKIQSFH